MLWVLFSSLMPLVPSPNKRSKAFPFRGLCFFPQAPPLPPPSGFGPMLTGQCPSEDRGAGANGLWDFHIPGKESPSFLQGVVG